MNCWQFRFWAGAELRELTLAQRLHVVMCQARARYRAEMQRRGDRIEAPLSLMSFGRTEGAERSAARVATGFQTSWRTAGASKMGRRTFSSLRWPLWE